MAKQPLRTYRAEDEVYDPAKRTADALGDSLSAVIRDALAAYTKTNARRARAARVRAHHAEPTLCVFDDNGVCGYCGARR